jgi:hypothetical protein
MFSLTQYLSQPKLQLPTKLFPKAFFVGGGEGRKGGKWGLNSGPHTLARQAHYHLSHTLALFALGVFQIGSLIFARAGLDCNPPDFYLLSSWDYSCELLSLAFLKFLMDSLHM